MPLNLTPPLPEPPVRPLRRGVRGRGPAASPRAALRRPPPRPSRPRAAPAAPGHSIDLDAMDRTAKPGDDFFHYANGAWFAKRAEIPRRSHVRRRPAPRARGDRRADEGPPRRGGERGRGPAAQEDRRLLREPTWTRRASRSAARRRSRTRSHRIAKIDGRARPRRGCSARACAPTWTRSTTSIFHTDERPRPVGGARPQRSLRATPPTSCRAASACPTASYYLDAATPTERAIGTQYQAPPRRHAAARGDRATRGKRAARVFASREAASRRPTRRARTPRTSPRPTTPGRAATSPSARRASTGTPSSPRRASTASRRSSCGTRARSRGSPALVKSEPLDAWKDYLAAHAIDRRGAVPARRRSPTSTSPSTGQELSPASETPPPRWKRAIDVTNDALGEAVGKAYVARYFPPESKQRIEGMVAKLLAAFGRRIDALAWMTPRDEGQGQGQARDAAGRRGLSRRVARRLRPGHRARRRARQRGARRGLHAYRRRCAKLGKPVDRGEWAMTPQIVNAVNLPVRNALNFPAGDPVAAVLRPAGDAQRRTTARSARPSATRSATASTTGRAVRRRTASSPTGGRPRTSRTSRPPARRSPRSTTLTSLSPTCTSTAS